MESIRPDLCIKMKDDAALEFGPNEANCSFFASIDNAYREYLDGADSLEESIDRFARVAIAVLNEDPLSASDTNALVPVLGPATISLAIPAPRLPRGSPVILSFC